MTPSRNDGVTIACPVCATPFVPIGRRRYCRDACRVAAHRLRHRADEPDEVMAPPASPRRASTVYECPSCEARVVGEQRCEDCGAFMRRVGFGGQCPCCDEAVTVDDLLSR